MGTKASYPLRISKLTLPNLFSQLTGCTRLHRQVNKLCRFRGSHSGLTEQCQHSHHTHVNTTCTVQLLKLAGIWHVGTEQLTPLLQAERIQSKSIPRNFSSYLPKPFQPRAPGALPDPAYSTLHCCRWLMAWEATNDNQAKIASIGINYKRDVAEVFRDEEVH